jgi:alpha-L-fucosidase 2
MKAGLLSRFPAGLFPLILMIAAPPAARPFDPLRELKAYDVVWDRPGEDARGSMPVGNGDIGLNVWAETATGSVCFYIGKTDAWDENGRLLKLTKIRLRLDPNPFRPGAAFRQRLDLVRATVEIAAGAGPDETRILVWVDANRPVVRVEARVPAGCVLSAGIEPWRLKPETLKDELVSGLNYYPALFGPTVVQPDTVLDGPSNEVVWFHRNPETPSFRKNLVLQGLDAFPLADPLKDRIFGGVLEGEGFVKGDPKTLTSRSDSLRRLNVHILTRQPDTPDGWLAAVERQAVRTRKTGWSEARKAHDAWWREFWGRSWIFVKSEASLSTTAGTENEGLVVTRGYVLQRFINACAGRGGCPIKFNGSIFTVEASGTEGFADYRRWGPGYWWQNTRLPYMSMPAAGDFDLLQPFFRMYAGLLPLGRFRTQLYFGHDGVYFPECIYFWGAVFTETWGDKYLADMPERIQASGWHKYEWVCGLEMAAQMYDYYVYTEDRAFLRETLLPFAEAVLTFFDKHYGVDEGGRLKLVPSQALETWWECVNAMPEVAGLNYLTRKLRTLPGGLLTAEQKSFLDRLEAKLPAVPTREVEGRRMLAPAEMYAKKQNVENPELYAVYPFRLYGVGKPDFELAIRALDAREDKGHFGWRQDDLFMALLGLTERARQGLTERAGRWNPEQRFPAFWGPNYDWTPDQDHGGVLTKTLQCMLLQCDDREIRLRPAWPADWDADFRLRAPFNTVLEGQVRAGKLVGLRVTPRSRESDIR